MSYAKAIYAYQTSVLGDLEVQVDDIIEILEQVDGNWYRARLKERTGLVPCEFVQRLANVNLNEGQELYAAHTDYRSTHEGDLQFRRGDLLIVHEHLANDWLRGSLHFDLPGTTYRPTGIFPSTFVTSVNGKSKNIQTNSSQTDLLSFESNPIKFVRVICDIRPNSGDELGCFEDEILAVIEETSGGSEWLTVKNRFNTIGRIQRRFAEPIDEKQIDDERNDLLVIPKIPSKTTNPLDSLQDLICKEFDQLMNKTPSQTAGG